jgi:hypothetical protein
MRRAPLLVAVALATAGAAACGGKQVPQHSGYKGKKPTPWTKAKPIELDEEFKAKVSGELDYADFKRARWYSLTMPGPGTITLDFEFVPSGDEEMDVAFEVLDPNNKVLVRADADADDVNEQKKQRKLADLDEGTYLIHVYLQGRLDSADFDLKVAFQRGTKVWKSDFPNQVAFLGDLAAVPPVDDTPAKAPPPARCGVPGKPKCVRRPPPPPPDKPPPTGGPGPLTATITDVKPDNAGARIVIGAGTSDGAADGQRGRVSGVKGASFTLQGCNPVRCTAVVKVSVDEVRGAREVVINR